MKGELSPKDPDSALCHGVLAICLEALRGSGIGQAKPDCGSCITRRGISHK